ncbi:hypothetical protein HELRODRAFT_182185 [Helobdella robusta]|uniref:Uncharacterized protein n=1 Tax=Helobdella robusta TaxID=6412 RepID=T1FHW3_HELRO|nr:hypothetical protein HELRODRAFT_182185 [Helobdella robusta]ESN91213.1 hypothetical protein HELRODRAFT_182185 [Helobdella robusta]
MGTHGELVAFNRNYDDVLLLDSGFGVSENESAISFRYDSIENQTLPKSSSDGIGVTDDKIMTNSCESDKTSKLNDNNDSSGVFLDAEIREIIEKIINNVVNNEEKIETAANSESEIFKTVVKRDDDQLVKQSSYHVKFMNEKRNEKVDQKTKLTCDRALEILGLYKNQNENDSSKINKNPSKTSIKSLEPSDKLESKTNQLKSILKSSSKTNLSLSNPDLFRNSVREDSVNEGELLSRNDNPQSHLKLSEKETTSRGNLPVRKLSAPVFASDNEFNAEDNFEKEISLDERVENLLKMINECAHVRNNDSASSKPNYESSPLSGLSGLNKLTLMLQQLSNAREDNRYLRSKCSYLEFKYRPNYRRKFGDKTYFDPNIHGRSDYLLESLLLEHDQFQNKTSSSQQKLDVKRTNTDPESNLRSVDFTPKTDTKRSKKFQSRWEQVKKVFTSSQKKDNPLFKDVHSSKSKMSSERKYSKSGSIKIENLCIPEVYLTTGKDETEMEFGQKVTKTEFKEKLSTDDDLSLDKQKQIPPANDAKVKKPIHKVEFLLADPVQEQSGDDSEFEVVHKFNENLDFKIRHAVSPDNSSVISFEEVNINCNPVQTIVPDQQADKKKVPEKRNSVVSNAKRKSLEEHEKHYSHSSFKTKDHETEAQSLKNERAITSEQKSNSSTNLSRSFSSSAGRKTWEKVKGFIHPKKHDSKIKNNSKSLEKITPKITKDHKEKSYSYYEVKPDILTKSASRSVENIQPTPLASDHLTGFPAPLARSRSERIKRSTNKFKTAVARFASPSRSRNSKEGSWEKCSPTRHRASFTSYIGLSPDQFKYLDYDKYYQNIKSKSNFTDCSVEKNYKSSSDEKNILAGAKIESDKNKSDKTKKVIAGVEKKTKTVFNADVLGGNEGEDEDDGDDDDDDDDGGGEIDEDRKLTGGNFSLLISRSSPNNNLFDLIIIIVYIMSL